MKNKKQFVHRLTKEQIEQTRHMSAAMRLQWLEEANDFINKTLGVKRRAQFDKRFKVFLSKPRRVST
ncbi:MAG: hypothetical protein M0Z48_09290 [Nitrospiraceae bacterium]|nr:hypothetical protein [Nitrospiraceae bacterium]